MRNKYVFVSVLLLMLALAGVLIVGLSDNAGVQEKSEGSIQVVTSFYPVYIAARNVIEDTEGVVLTNLTEPKTGCLHDYQLTPRDVVSLSQADLFIINGGGMESFLGDVSAQNPKLTIANASEGITYLDMGTGPHSDAKTASHNEVFGAEHDHSHDNNEGSSSIMEDDINSNINAHVWMDISRYQEEVENIAQALGAIDSKNKEQYQSNAGSYINKLKDLQKKAEVMKSDSASKDVVIFHESFAYLADEFGLNVRYTIEMDENTALSANDMSRLIDLMKDQRINIILAEKQFGTEAAKTIAAETGASVYILDSLVTGDGSGDSYLNGMIYNLDILKEALKP